MVEEKGGFKEMLNFDPSGRLITGDYTPKKEFNKGFNNSFGNFNGNSSDFDDDSRYLGRG